MTQSRFTWLLLFVCTVVIGSGIVSEVIASRGISPEILPPAPEFSRKRLRLVDIGAVVARKIHGSALGRSQSNAVDLVDLSEWGPSDQSGESGWATFGRIMRNKMFLIGFSGVCALSGTGIIFSAMSLRSPVRRRRLMRRILGIAGRYVPAGSAARYGAGRFATGEPSESDSVADIRYARSADGPSTSRRGAGWREQPTVSIPIDSRSIRLRNIQNALAGEEEYV